MLYLLFLEEHWRIKGVEEWFSEPETQEWGTPGTSTERDPQTDLWVGERKATVLQRRTRYDSPPSLCQLSTECQEGAAIPALWRDTQPSAFLYRTQTRDLLLVCWHWFCGQQPFNSLSGSVQCLLDFWNFWEPRRADVPGNWKAGLTEWAEPSGLFFTSTQSGLQGPIKAQSLPGWAGG